MLKWEVSISEYKDRKGIKYKVTRRIPELHVAETRLFSNKKQAFDLFNKWLN